MITPKQKRYPLGYKQRFYGAFGLLRSDILGDEGRQSRHKRHRHYGQKSVQLFGYADAGRGRYTKGVYYACDNEEGYADKEVLKGYGRAYFQNIPHRASDFKIPTTYGEREAYPSHIKQRKDDAARLGKHRSSRRSGRSHIKDADQYKVADNIYHAGDGDEYKWRTGIAKPTEYAAYGVIGCDEHQCRRNISLYTQPRHPKPRSGRSL